MKRVLLIIGISLSVILISVGLFFLVRFITDKTFKLESKYYGNGEYLKLDEKKLDNLIKNKESFVVFVYQPMCAASDALAEVLDDFMGSTGVNFYKISYGDMKKTVLNETITYYPSVVIYKNGEIQDYLDPNDGDDTEYFKDPVKFLEWFANYVKLGQYNSIEKLEEKSEINHEYEIMAEIDGLSYSEDVINVYFFWGDGCPHCKDLHAYFDEIESQYGDLYELHDFEVWYNKDNLSIMAEFGEKMGIEIDGIPLLIIGDKVFEGFGDEYKPQILKAIINQHKNSFDAYFENRLEK